jgi:hypothetical protein
VGLLSDHDVGGGLFVDRVGGAGPVEEDALHQSVGAQWREQSQVIWCNSAAVVAMM